MLQRRPDAADRRIDQLADELYKLKAAVSAIIEEASSAQLATPSIDGPASLK